MLVLKKSVSVQEMLNCGTGGGYTDRVEVEISELDTDTCGTVTLSAYEARKLASKLLRALGLPGDPLEVTREEIQQANDGAGNKLAAIDAYAERTGAGLVEAREAIDIAIENYNAF